MGSSIPLAVPYWVNLAATTLNASTDTPNGSTPYVYFGARLGRYIAPLTLQVIGVVDIIHNWAEVGANYRVEETYKIRNEIVSFAGGFDQAARMQEVFNNFNLLAVAVSAPENITLGNSVRLCLPMCDGEYQPGVDPKGQTMGSLMFDIHVEVRITSTT
jgi:hypothetical protein